MPQASRAVVFHVAAVALAGACGGKMIVEGAPSIDVCTVWAARQVETDAPLTPGSCLTCWERTIFVQPNGDGGFRNGICHDDQAHCVGDQACEAVLRCVTPCRDAACVDACIGAADPQPSRDLFLDWSRCFALECATECTGPADPSQCAESHR
jgi:hypothetical protein